MLAGPETSTPNRLELGSDDYTEELRGYRVPIAWKEEDLITRLYDSTNVDEFVLGAGVNFLVAKKAIAIIMRAEFSAHAK